MSEQAIRQHWRGLQGRTPLNVNWSAVGADSTVQVTASEYIPNPRDPQHPQRFVGAASIVVRNVTPHGPPYDPNRGVTFVVDVAWGSPLNVVTDIVLLDARTLPPMHPVLRWRRLGIAVQLQQQTNWCWAAVAVSVEIFYGGNRTQCALANTVLGRTDCCGAGGPGPCNQTSSTRNALTTVGHLAGWDDTPATRAQIRAEIDAGRPVGVRVAWAGGGAHALVVDGYLEQDAWVAVDDPWFGASDLRLDALTSSYQGSGTMTHHYLTS